MTPNICTVYIHAGLEVFHRDCSTSASSVLYLTLENPHDFLSVSSYIFFYHFIYSYTGSGPVESWGLLWRAGIDPLQSSFHPNLLFLSLCWVCESVG